MSLLNEALRKNRSEKMQKVIFNTPSQEANIPARAILYIVLFAAVAAGFTYIWTREAYKISATPDNTQQAGNAEVNSIAKPASANVKAEIKDTEQAVIEETMVKNESPYSLIQEKPDMVPVPEITGHKTVRETEKKDENPAFFNNPEPVEKEEYFLKKAVQLHKQARLENAIMMYEKVLNLNPSNTEALFNMASIYITMSRYQDAYDILSKLTVMDNADSKTMLNLAVAEIGLEKYSDALLHLDNPGVNDPGLLFEISFHRGVALSRIGRPDDAIKSYRAAEKINSHHPALLLNMAVLYDRYGSYSEAVDYYTKLINSDFSKPVEKGIYKNRIEQLSAHLPGSDGNGFGRN